MEMDVQMASKERLVPLRADDGPVPHIRVEPSKGWVSLRLRELWEYRELLYFLIWRDVKVRYKQTVLGAAWAIIQPFFTMVVFSLFFGKLAKIPSDGIPYPIFSYAALVPWTFFANGLSQASIGMVRHANLIKKVYFPRLAIPIARVLAGAVDFVLAFTVLLGNLGVVHLIRATLIKLGGEPFPSTIPGFAETVAMFKGLWQVVGHGGYVRHFEAGIDQFEFGRDTAGTIQRANKRLGLGRLRDMLAVGEEANRLSGQPSLRLGGWLAR